MQTIQMFVSLEKPYDLVGNRFIAISSELIVTIFNVDVMNASWCWPVEGEMYSIIPCKGCQRIRNILVLSCLFCYSFKTIRCFQCDFMGENMYFFMQCMQSKSQSLNGKSLIYLNKSCTATFCRRAYGLKEITLVSVLAD